MITEFINLLFPRCCVITNEPLAKGEQHISINCAYRLPRYHLKEYNESLHQRFYGITTLKHAFAYYKFSKKSRVQKLIHHIKYRNGQELGEMVATWYGHALKEAGYQAEFDLIVVVPLHKAKLKRRGYNQCDCIAKGLSKALAIPWEATVLWRKADAKSQTKMDRIHRFANTNDLYSVLEVEKVQGKKILLIDDVITTGATVSMCANLLLKAGCSQVSVAALASPE